MQFQPFAYMAPSGEDYEFLLDEYGTNCEAAFSLRKLRSAYTASAIEITRASDSTTTNIGFDADNNIDSSAITSFCSGTTCSVSKWYNQNDTGSYFADNTSGGPMIYTGGNLVTGSNGKVAVDFATSKDLNVDSFAAAWIDGKSNFEFDAYLALTAPAGSTYHQALRIEGGGGTSRFAFTFTPSADGPKKWQILTDTGSPSTSLRSTDSYVTGTEYVMSYNGSGSNAQIFANGVQKASGSVESGTYNMNDAAFGSDPNGTEFFDAKMQELIFYNKQKTADRTNITNNINAYYNYY